MLDPIQTQSNRIADVLEHHGVPARMEGADYRAGGVRIVATVPDRAQLWRDIAAAVDVPGRQRRVTVTVVVRVEDVCEDVQG